MQVEDAIASNLAWYEVIARLHGAHSRCSADHWWSRDPMPPYHSNLVTRRADAEAHLARLRALAADPPAAHWSMNDSHDALDPEALRGLGFAPRFGATWYGLPPGAPCDGPGETGLGFEAVADAAALATWEAAWQVASPTPARMFPPALLTQPGWTFHMGRRDGQVVGVFVTHASPGPRGPLVGLSNAFALEGTPRGAFLRDCLRIARNTHPDCPIVGYESADEVAALEAFGVRALGPLRIWVTESSLGASSRPSIARLRSVPQR